MIVLKSRAEIRAMGRANRIVAEILAAVKQAAKPGVTTWDLETLARAEIRRRGVKAAFQGVPNLKGEAFPCVLCTSINDEVVHGIPSPSRVLRDGDLLSVDFGVVADGFYGDAAFSVCVGRGAPRAERLIRVAEEALEAGIREARPGRRVGDISAAIQGVVEAAGFSVVREFVGHGIGRSLHEEPQVPNFGSRGSGVRLRPGMVLALEPMINDGGVGVVVDRDGWTARTRDGSLAAHAEHTVAITERGPLVLTRLT
ncbi:type I methionyl aminopeptidase [Deferrisoma camini]|uniref:type I methionyl aminopeptidase n=1 Tax=Deferrisoma camini TaxID=1035120 RepID=UPI00046D0D72|nr:type I methionyl aminopeptidase [Deferrisoma camini]